MMILTNSQEGILDKFSLFLVLMKIILLTIQIRGTSPKLLTLNISQWKNKPLKKLGIPIICLLIVCPSEPKGVWQCMTDAHTNITTNTLNRPSAPLSEMKENIENSFTQPCKVYRTLRRLNLKKKLHV